MPAHDVAVTTGGRGAGTGVRHHTYPGLRGVEPGLAIGAGLQNEFRPLGTVEGNELLCQGEVM